jgi:plastocyanin
MKHIDVMFLRLITPGWRVGLIFSLAAIIILGTPVSLSTTSTGERYIRVEASRYAFTPEQINISPGERVTIELVATDVKHGLSLDGHRLELEAEPGQPARATFMATQPGVYRFRCSVACGNLHPFMLGKIQIGPNLPLIRGSLLGAIAILIALFSHYKPQPYDQSTPNDTY